MHQILVDIPTQKLYHLLNAKVLKCYLISTGKKGVGEKRGSEKTPRGWHVIRAKIGEGYQENTVFVGRRPTGEIYSEELGALYPERDWILSRILWLSGLELYKNRLKDCDTMQRYIYIHGCPDSKIMGFPDSNGCIRMRNKDIIELFDKIDVGLKVYIRG